MNSANTSINKKKTINETLHEYFQFLVKDSVERNNYLKYTFLYSLLIAVTILFFHLPNIKKDFSKDTMMYLFISVGMLIVGSLIIYPSIQTAEMNKIVVISFVIISFIVFLFSYLLYYLTSSELKMMQYVLFIISVVIISVAAAIGVYVTGSYYKNRPGIIGFLLNFILYIPCLIISMVEYFTKEYNMTSSPVFILLNVEAILIALYFVLPFLVNYYLKKTSVTVLKESAFLHSKQILYTETTALLTANKAVNKSKMDKKDKSQALILKNEPKFFHHNFSISMWVYSNVQTLSSTATKEFEIFSYGVNKPSISYLTTTSNADKKDVFLFRFTNEKPERLKTEREKSDFGKPFFKETKSKIIKRNSSRQRNKSAGNRLLSKSAGNRDGFPRKKPMPKPKPVVRLPQFRPLPLPLPKPLPHNNHLNEKTVKHHLTSYSPDKVTHQVTVPSQRWNNFVINYDSNTVDLFVNGNLEKTVNFSKLNIPPPKYLAHDQISIGSDQGIKGAICNIQYYTSPLSKEYITNMYNILKMKNPPTY